MISKKLLDQLELAYPSADTDYPDESVLGSGGMDTAAKRLGDALFDTGFYSGLDWDINSKRSKINSLIVNLDGHPRFRDWQTWDRPRKLVWIETNKGPYPVLRIVMSRVAKYYYYFFNDWVPRGDTGYLDAQFHTRINGQWKPHLDLVKAILGELDYAHFPRERNTELVPGFVADGYDAIADDDPRWEQADFVPPSVPAILWDCLFEY